MKLEIRSAKLEEQDYLSDLVMRSKQSNGYDDEFMNQCRDELAVLGEEIEAGEYRVAVEAGNPGQALGCSALSSMDEKNAAEIYALFIDPEFKRKGIGQALWKDLLEQAKRQGVKKLYLDADPEAVFFYEAQGFRIEGMTPSGSIEGRELPHMVYDLT